MKIVHLVGWYFPESRGGSEVYVEALAREQTALGHEVLVAAPHDAAEEQEYHHENIAVYRYPAGEGSAELLARWIAKQKPGIAHFHSWTSGLNHEHVKRVHELGARIYLTMHTASSFCARDTMMRWDRVACDGEMGEGRCAACYFHRRGLPLDVSLLLSWLGNDLPFISNLVQGRLRTALKYPASVSLRRSQLHQAWACCHKVVAVCQWVKDAVRINGCPEGKLVLSRQGATFKDPGTERPLERSKGILRVGYSGRLDPVKGVTLLVDAFQRLPAHFNVVLELKGIPQHEAYVRELHRRLRGDARIRLVPPSSSTEVRAWMRSIDVLVVPSLWMESGPLVVYEAFALQIPVIGSGQGGIAEIVRNGVNGLLFERGSVEDLHRVLRRVCEEPRLLEELRAHITTARTMHDVAMDMEEVYR